MTMAMYSSGLHVKGWPYRPKSAEQTFFVLGNGLASEMRMCRPTRILNVCAKRFRIAYRASGTCIQTTLFSKTMCVLTTFIAIFVAKAFSASDDARIVVDGDRVILETIMQSTAEIPAPQAPAPKT
jgi:hypothetical protein